MRNPVARRVRTCIVGLRLFPAALAVALVGAAGTARADNPILTGDVGVDDSFTITLVDTAGNKVTHLAAGTYTLTVHDHSDFHNFHLSGPGVDASTSVDFIGDQSFTVTLVDGTYFFTCDPHSSQMKGSFTVGAVTTPLPTTPPALVSLTASIGPGATFTLAPVGGLSPGKVVITVRDRSASDGFRLFGPGVAKATSAGFRGTVKWTVTLKAGRYVYGSVRSAKLRRSFLVTG